MIEDNITSDQTFVHQAVIVELLVEYRDFEDVFDIELVVDPLR